jgi:hypothetical protein
VTAWQRIRARWREIATALFFWAGSFALLSGHVSGPVGFMITLASVAVAAYQVGALVERKRKVDRLDQMLQETKAIRGEAIEILKLVNGRAGMHEH